MIKKTLFLFLILITTQLCSPTKTSRLFAAEKLDKILNNSFYSQEQKIEKISLRADELLREINSINQQENNNKKNNREVKKLKLYKDIQTEISFINNEGLSPLKFCALNGDYNSVEKLLALNAPLNSNQNVEPSVLMVALRAPNVSLKLIQLLVNKGADCDFYFSEKINNINYKTTVLHYACLTENPEIISYIIHKSSKNLDSKMPDINRNGIVNSKNALALLCQIQIKYYKAASDINFYSCIEQLLNKKSNLINADYFDNGYKGTVLHMAAKNNEKHLYKTLKKYGANNQSKDNKGFSSLHYLESFCKNDVDMLDLLYEEFSGKDKQKEKSDLLKKLIEEDINQQTSSDNKTALLIAINNKDYETVELLLQSGADYELSDSLNKNAVHYAIEQKDLTIFNLLTKVDFVPESSTIDYAIIADQKEMVSFLLEKQVYSQNAILLALEEAQKKENNKYEIVHLLLSKQINNLENTKYADNVTLLMQFIKLGDAELLKQVLPHILRKDKKALEQKDFNGWTPFLYAAVYNTDPKMLKILRMYGANISVQDIHKKNAAALAKGFNPNWEEIVNTLNKYGVY